MVTQGMTKVDLMQLHISPQCKQFSHDVWSKVQFLVRLHESVSVHCRTVHYTYALEIPSCPTVDQPPSTTSLTPSTRILEQLFPCSYFSACLPPAPPPVIVSTSLLLLLFKVATQLATWMCHASAAMEKGVHKTMLLFLLDLFAFIHNRHRHTSLAFHVPAALTLLRLLLYSSSWRS